mmetsp:Transcript_22687/g.37293  ORF Transcript_22687/g.37293 Transcript_22687/m.37293 type:complete len:221 (+) Transcript_22687:584-1246(+)
MQPQVFHQTRPFRREIPTGQPWICPQVAAPKVRVHPHQSAPRQRQERPSRPIIRVYVDISVGQIAGPNGHLSGPHPNIRADANVVGFHMLRRLLFRVVRADPSLVRDQSVAKPDRQCVSIRWCAGLANRHHDPAPVGVLTRDRGFDEGGIGNGQGMGFRRGLVCCPGHPDLNKLRGPLAVAHHLVCKVTHDVAQGGFETGIGRCICATCTGCRHHQAVRG